ncbi:MAG TPA: TonB-dependent receptor [Chryseosolibacter sp.]
MSLISKFWLCCFILSANTSIFAQEIEPDSVVFLDELIVPGNKIVEPRSKVAQQVYIMPATELRILNSQTMADVLSNSGVVGVQKSQQGGGSPQLRGFEASRVLLMVDGVRMNNLIYRAGHLQNVITIDNTVLDNVEILLGPSSTSYGSDALGGVVSMRTKGPRLRGDGTSMVSGSGFYRYGSVNNEQTRHLDFNIAFKKFALFTGMTSSDFGHLRMGKKINPSYGEPFGLRNVFVQRSADNASDVLVGNNNPYVQRFSGYSQSDFMQKILYKPSAKFSHLLNYQHSMSSNIPRYDRLTDPEGDGLRHAEWYYGPQERFLGSYELGVNALGSLADEMKLIASYQHVSESRHDRRFGQNFRRHQLESVDVAGLTIDFVKHFNKSQLRYGFDSQLNWLQSTAYRGNIVAWSRGPADTRYPGGGSKMNYFALYLTDIHDLSQKLTLNSGVRVGISSLNARFADDTFLASNFQDFDQQNEYASGNLGLILRPNGSWKFSLLSSTGYRVPNIDDLAKVFETKAGELLIVPNPDIKPEQTVNLDLGVTTFISDKVRWENNAFYTSFYNAIVLDDFTLNGNPSIVYEGQPTPVVANQNKRRARIVGISSVLSGTLSKHFLLKASYNLTKGRIISENRPLDHIPPAFGRIDINYRKKKIESSVFVNFNGWKRIEDYYLKGEDNEQYATPEGMPSWYTINLRAGYSLNSYVVLQVGIDNLLDLQYRTFASGINAPGRNFFGTVRATF